MELAQLGLPDGCSQKYGGKSENAQEQGIAILKKSREQVHTEAVEKIKEARRATQVLMKEKIIAPAPSMPSTL